MTDVTQAENLNMSDSSTEGLSSSNSKAIVVYVDDTPRCLEEFSWLYKTWKMWDLDNEFDLVAYCNPNAVKKLPDDKKSLVIREMAPIHKTNPEWSSYPFVNSFGMFSTNINEFRFIQKYSHIMRTDCDVFLTQHLAGHAPSRVMLGMGGYIDTNHNGHVTVENLDRLRKKLNLKTNYIFHVGASLFGPTTYVLLATVKHFDYTREILSTEWKESHGRWEDGWFAGVSSMYAIHLAVNSLFSRQNVITCALDELCWGTTKISKSVVHIHAWHCAEYFSKHEWFAGKYEKLICDTVPEDAAQYCHWVASNDLDHLRKVAKSTMR